MSGVLLNSTVVIDLLRGHRPALDYVLSIGAVPAASEITRVEVLRGIRSGERRLTERLLGTFRWFPLDEAVARRAGDLGRRWRASHRGIATADLVIAATAIEHELDLATLNVRHFPMFDGLAPPYARDCGLGRRQCLAPAVGIQFPDVEPLRPAGPVDPADEDEDLPLRIEGKRRSVARGRGRWASPAASSRHATATCRWTSCRPRPRRRRA